MAIIRLLLSSRLFLILDDQVLLVRDGRLCHLVQLGDVRLVLSALRNVSLLARDRRFDGPVAALEIATQPEKVRVGLNEDDLRGANVSRHQLALATAELLEESGVCSHRRLARSGTARAEMLRRLVDDNGVVFGSRLPLVHLLLDLSGNVCARPTAADGERRRSLSGLALVIRAGRAAQRTFDEHEREREDYKDEDVKNGIDKGALPRSAGGDAQGERADVLIVRGDET